jgi:hypothetical protein
MAEKGPLVVECFTLLKYRLPSIANLDFYY